MPYTIEGKEVIILGDTTTHGGKVISGSENHTYMGIPVARVGDMVLCPKCKGTYPIIEGASRTFDHRKPIARHGDKVACGATFISRGNMTDTAPTLSSHIYAPAPGNTSIDTPNRRDDPGYPKLEAMPKAPPPLEDYQMRGFHRQAEKQGLGDRKTLGRYVLVANGISMNSGYSNGWESYNIPINEEALVYVKNIHGIFITPVNVRAGILSINLQQQGILLPPGFNHIFKFRNQVGKWYLSVGSATDAYMLEYEVWTRVKYAD